ncbi:TPA: hypothetical protein ACHB3O_004615 [Klebsiella pneumoniae]
MTKSTITRERLEWLSQISCRDDIEDIGGDEIRELASMALAVMNTEPVALQPELAKVIYHIRDWNEGFPVERFKADYVISWMLANYPPAPPAPVVSADLLHTAASAIEDLLTTKDRTGAGVWFDLPFRLRSAANAQPAPEKYNIGDATMRHIFTPTGMTNVSDMQAVFDRVEAVLVGMDQPAPVVPDGYVMVPMRLTAENGAKGALSGEFSETKFVNCPECFGDDECETCDGSGRIEITVPVTWTTIKEIWAKGVEHFAAAPQGVK